MSTKTNPFLEQASASSASVSEVGSGNISTLAHAAEILGDPSHPDYDMAAELISRENGGVLPTEAERNEIALTGEISSRQSAVGGNPFGSIADAGQKIANETAINSHTSNVSKEDLQKLQAKLQVEAVGPEGSTATKQAARLAGMGEDVVAEAQERADVNAESLSEHMNARPGETLAQTQERMEKEAKEKQQDGHGKESDMAFLGSVLGLFGAGATMAYAINQNNHGFDVSGLGASGTENILEMEAGLSNSARMASQAANISQTMPAKSSGIQQNMNG